MSAASRAGSGVRGRQSSAGENRLSKNSHSAHSGSSRASISVTLPTARNPSEDLQRKSPVNVRGLSPDRYGRLTRSFTPQSSGTVPPAATPTHPIVISDAEVQQILSARIIERAWLSYRDQQMFKLLKHAVCAAEHSLSYEVLRKVSPKEAELLKDKSMSSKVRFRFGGTEFPPSIFFKIYSSTSSGMGLQYVSGRKMIQPASEAARDACGLMGHRKFYDQMIQDVIQQETHKITGEVDVTTLKDYMQYLSLMDETPSYMGGKDNSWRRLTLEALPRFSIFYDVVDYLYNQKMSKDLERALPTLLSRPMTEDVQLEHIKIISQYRTPAITPYNTPKSKMSLGGGSQTSGRRSKQARSRAHRMKKAYETQKDVPEHQPPMIREGDYEGHPAGVHFGNDALMQQYADMEEWEEEADKLYEWTRELTLDELVTPTPRLSAVP